MKKLLVFLLTFLPIVATAAHKGDLKADTAATIKVCVSDATDATPETSWDIDAADVRLSKNGGNMAAKNDATDNAAHDELGCYDVAIDATDTNTEGRLEVLIYESGMLRVSDSYSVLGADYYDLKYGATGVLTSRDAGLMLSTDVDTVTNQTTLILTAGASNNDAYNNATATLIGGTEECEAKVVDYVGSTTTVTLYGAYNSGSDACPFTIAPADLIRIHAGSSGTAVQTLQADSDIITGSDGVVIETSGVNATSVDGSWSATLASATNLATAQTDLDTITGSNGVLVADDAITSAKIAADAIGASEIATDAIGAAELAANSITSSEIASGAITSAKFASGAIDAAAIATDAIGAAEIAASAITNSEMAIDGSELTAVPWNANWDTEVQSEADDALVAKGLDHLVAASVVGADVTDNSIIAKMVSKTVGTADWDTFNNITDSLEGSYDSLASTQGTINSNITGLNDLSAAQVNAEVDTALGDYDAPTKAELDSGLAALNDLSAAQVNAEVDTALSDYDAPTKAELDSGLAALNDPDAATITAAVLAAVIEDQGATYDLQCTLAAILAYAAGDVTTSSGTSTYKEASSTENRIVGSVSGSTRNTTTITCP